jgi:hypothetical protein
LGDAEHVGMTSRMRALLVAISFVATALVAGVSASAQQPPPNGVASDCSSIDGATLTSGQQAQLTDPQESLVVDLVPPGDYRSEPSGFPGDAKLNICHVQTNASVTISAVTGLEVSRVAAGDAGNAVLDALVANAHPGPGQPSPVPIFPPDTGDGGLLPQ